jgi:hypothetical protein
MHTQAYKAVTAVDNGVYSTPFEKTYGQKCQWLEGSVVEMTTPCCFLPTVELVQQWLSNGGDRYGYDTIVKCELIETQSDYGFNNGIIPSNTVYATKFKIIGAVD